jgi:hypothetical protein
MDLAQRTRMESAATTNLPQEVAKVPRRRLRPERSAQARNHQPHPPTIIVPAAKLAAAAVSAAAGSRKKAGASGRVWADRGAAGGSRAVVEAVEDVGEHGQARVIVHLRTHARH